MINQLINSLSQLDGHVGMPAYQRSAHASQMRTDIVETDNGYSLHIEVPGISRDNIDVDFEAGLLTVTAKAKQAGDKDRYHLRERVADKSTRRFRLPARLTKSDIKAKLASGVLTLTVTKPDRDKLREATQVTVN